MLNVPLLPFCWKRPGWLLLILGAAGLAAYLLFDLPLRVPVFAVISSFLETKYFTVLHTSISDELILLTLLAGCVLLCFSEEREEKEAYAALRVRALRLAVMCNTLLMAVSILFIYGTGFLAVLAMNLYSPFLLYLAIFQTLKRKDRTGTAAPGG